MIQSKACGAENQIGHCQDLIGIVHIGQGGAHHPSRPGRTLAPFQATSRNFFTPQGRLQQLLDFTQQIINGLMRQGADGQAQGTATLLRLQDQRDEHAGEHVRFAGARRAFDQSQRAAKG